MRNALQTITSVSLPYHFRTTFLPPKYHQSTTELPLKIRLKILSRPILFTFSSEYFSFVKTAQNRLHALSKKILLWYTPLKMKINVRRLLCQSDCPNKSRSASRFWLLWDVYQRGMLWYELDSKRLTVYPFWNPNTANAKSRQHPPNQNVFTHS